MKYMSEFRDAEAAKAIASSIKEGSQGRELKIMEVCGGHTITIYRFGIKDLLPENIHLISGPGCPVCVTATSFVDHTIALSELPDTIIASFGDLIRVPGSHSSLLKEKAKGRDIRACYSSMDAVDIAKNNPQKQVVFLGIGFETTAPTVAASLKYASQEGISNFYVLSAHKTMPNAMRALVESGELNLDAFICPGHVSTITGLDIYDFLAKDYGTPCVVSGFEPLDLLQSIQMIVKQVQEGRAEVENQYTRAVTREGNRVAREIMESVFDASDMEWRGLGVIMGSGLSPNPSYRKFDAQYQIPVEMEIPSVDNPACICGDIMRGMKEPVDCTLFAKACTPEDPKGACMVSEEGSCATFYKYAR
jgi:hydrogenase expression/formation protein HypD